MELYSLEKVTFCYNKGTLSENGTPRDATWEPSLKEVSLSINQGDFCVLGGPSGSGKTTLLRLMKPELIPGGKMTGYITYQGDSIVTITNRKSSEEIGYVFQSPDTQIVTDKVWHELAFGLENMGIEPLEIRRRVGEIADFFGITKWFDKEINELSGGQKQLVNLAAIMVMRPNVLLLDEPTAQLDPLAAEEFLNILLKIHEEMGLTIVLSEHNFQRVLSMCNKLVILDNGEIVASGMGTEVLETIEHTRLLELFPQWIQFFYTLKQKKHNEMGKYPLTISEMKNRLYTLIEEKKLTLSEVEQVLAQPEESKIEEKPVILKGKSLSYSYEKQSEMILNKIDIKCIQGTITAIAGGNGSGKTTLLKVLSGVLMPIEGKLYYKNSRWLSNQHEKIEKKIGYLPQNPLDLFVFDSVLEELQEVHQETLDDDETSLMNIAREYEIEELLSHHPYDLSGGEAQRVALAKIMLKKTDILFLDEPTKALDGLGKNQIVKSLKTYQKQGGTVILVSHDMEFCEQVADNMAMLFLGELVAIEPATDFFQRNYFYTTQRERIKKGLGLTKW